jgi:hypothetical protein
MAPAVVLNAGHDIAHLVRFKSDYLGERRVDNWLDGENGPSAFQAALPHRPGGHRVDAGREPLQVRSVRLLAEDQEPGVERPIKLQAVAVQAGPNSSSARAPSPLAQP